MSKFAAGAIRFQREVYPGKQELFERLSSGQSPEALFITCSDSRIETAMITQTEPGELFVCRNAGNIVPPHSEDAASGMAASIEFSVAALRVPHIVVCGHTECGAMHGAMAPDSLEALPQVKSWLSHSRVAAEEVQARQAELSPEEQLQLLIERNVVLQLEHLKSHPTVAARLADDDLELHGWVYNIKTGRVTAFDAKTDSFGPMEELYAETVASFFD